MPSVRLYDVWFDRIYDLVLRVVHDRDVAEEVGQEAFLSAWRNLAKLDDPMPFGGWLLRIARNGASTGRAEKRAAASRRSGLAVIEYGGGAVVAPAASASDAALARRTIPRSRPPTARSPPLVHEVVGALGERDAEVLDLQLRYGLTPAEIGEVIGLNRNAANQLCHRAEARFAAAFGARMLWNGSARLRPPRRRPPRPASTPSAPRR